VRGAIERPAWTLVRPDEKTLDTLDVPLLTPLVTR
jgi:hypothetical protein